MNSIKPGPQAMVAPGDRVAVVGAGIIGRLLAWRLARAGLVTTVFDQGDLDSLATASATAAGLLTPVSEAVLGGDADLLALGRDSVETWRGLLRQGLGPVQLLATGSLAMARAPELPALREFRERADRCAPDLGGLWLEGMALQESEPDLRRGPVVGAYLLPGEGAIDTHAVLAALRTDLEQQGASLRAHTVVQRLSPWFVEASHGPERFDLVVDCRGLGARADLPSLRGVRGEVVELEAPEVTLTRPIRVLHPRHPLYIVPRQPGRFIIGATAVESDDCGPVTVTGALELLGAAFTTHPGFQYARITRLAAQARPAFPDHRPRIAVENGLMRVNGLYRHGFLLAPIVTAAAAARILGDEPPATSHLLFGAAR